MHQDKSIKSGLMGAIEIDGRHVDYRLVPSKSARKMRVRVGPGGVEVVQPAGRSRPEVEEFLACNQDWIAGQLARVEAFARIRRPSKIEAGKILYRGESVSVQIEESPSGGAARVSYQNGSLVVKRSKSSPTPPEKSLENWLRKQARAAIQAYLAVVTGKLNRTPNRVYIMGQRTKWGNCSSRGNLSFNWRLIMAPDYVLRYLVTHEAVHLAIPDHSPKFWLTVRSLCPETERARQWLCAHGPRLFHP